MYPGDHVGTGQAQDVVIALEILPVSGKTLTTIVGLGKPLEEPRGARGLEAPADAPAATGPVL